MRYTNVNWAALALLLAALGLSAVSAANGASGENNHTEYGLDLETVLALNAVTAVGWETRTQLARIRENYEKWEQLPAGSDSATAHSAAAQEMGYGLGVKLSGASGYPLNESLRYVELKSDMPAGILGGKLPPVRGPRPWWQDSLQRVGEAVLLSWLLSRL